MRNEVSLLVFRELLAELRIHNMTIVAAASNGQEQLLWKILSPVKAVGAVSVPHQYLSVHGLCVTLMATPQCALSHSKHNCAEVAPGLTVSVCFPYKSLQGESELCSVSRKLPLSLSSDICMGQKTGLAFGTPGSV